MIDLHSHILPGLDDGVRDWDQALTVAYLAVEDGIEGMVCTPHFIRKEYENTREKITRAVEELRHRLRKLSIPLDVYPGAELRMAPELVSGLRCGELLTLNDSGRYALIELPADSIPPAVEETFNQLMLKDIVPIIAHPERNSVIQGSPERLFNWIEAGALTQVTGASLTGRFGKKIREFAALMLEHGMAHVIATDCHGPYARGPWISEPRRIAESLVGLRKARIMVEENPIKIVKGMNVEPFDLVPLPTPRNLTRTFFSFLRNRGITTSSSV